MVWKILALKIKVEARNKIPEYTYINYVINIIAGKCLLHYYYLFFMSNDM